MLKIYARAEEERRLLPVLAEFKCRVVSSRKIKGYTRKSRGGHKVVVFPIE